MMTLKILFYHENYFHLSLLQFAIIISTRIKSLGLSFSKPINEKVELDPQLCVHEKHLLSLSNMQIPESHTQQFLFSDVEVGPRNIPFSTHHGPHSKNTTLMGLQGASSSNRLGLHKTLMGY